MAQLLTRSGNELGQVSEAELQAVSETEELALFTAETRVAAYQVPNQQYLRRLAHSFDWTRSTAP